MLTSQKSKAVDYFKNARIRWKNWWRNFTCSSASYTSKILTTSCVSVVISVTPRPLPLSSRPNARTSSTHRSHRKNNNRTPRCKSNKCMHLCLINPRIWPQSACQDTLMWITHQCLNIKTSLWVQTTVPSKAPLPSVTLQLTQQPLMAMLMGSRNSSGRVLNCLISQRKA